MRGNLKMDINMEKEKWCTLQRIIMKVNGNLIKNKDRVQCIEFKIKKELLFLTTKYDNKNKYIV